MPIIEIYRELNESLFIF